MKKFIGAITAAVLLGAVSPIYETAITERVKLNSEFFGDDLVNLKLYGGDKDDTLRDIEKTSDGGYVGVGYTKSNAFGDIPPHIGDVDTAYGHITKFDANMNRQ